MRRLLQFCCLGLVAALWSDPAHGAINRQRSLVGKFLVSSVNGTATCASDGRVFELKAGDSLTARGAIVQTGPKSNVILVFSNGTGVYTDQNTRFEVVKFDQEFFAPNNNLRVEPSNSWTVVKLSQGRVIVSTPRLQSGTTMVYETPHAAVGIKGDKVLIEGDEKQTHIAMIAGTGTVNPRDAEGRFVSLGRRLVTGQEAFVKYTIRVAGGEGDAAKESAPNAAAGPGPAPAGSADAQAQTVAAGPAEPVTSSAEAVLVRTTGTTSIKLPGTTTESGAHEGMVLPRGTVVFTAEDGAAYLQIFPGVVATLGAKGVLQVGPLAVTKQGETVRKQVALLELQSGTLVSTLDPSRPGLNQYSVRTPHGIASAEGTSFFVRVTAEGQQVGTTADTVSFVSRTGTRYAIKAGDVCVTPPAGPTSAPVPLATVLAVDPRFGALLDDAFDAVATVVEYNLGGLPAASAVSLLSKVCRTATAARPAQAPALAARAVGAVTALTAATTPNAGAAVAAVTQSIVSAHPSQAAQIAVAAVQEAHAHDLTVGTGAARGSPPQAGPITAAVARALLQLDGGAGSPADPETISAVAAAITKCVPSQAAPVAAAAFKSLLEADPSSTPKAQARLAGIVGATVTAAAPNQAVPVARALMQLILQSLTDATPELVAQLGAVLAGSIINVVPDQTQEVATAVMQLIVQGFPNVTPAWVFDTAGMFAATLCQAFPPQHSAIIAGVSAATGISTADLEESVARYAGKVADWWRQIGEIGERASGAFQRASAGATQADLGSSLADVPSYGGIGTGSGGRGGTSITIGNNASATSIVISQFNPELVAQLTADIEAAQIAQLTVQFSTETTSGGTTIIIPEPVVPRDLPSDLVVSPAR